jgi:type VI secretion system secreted protein VgrG
MELLTHKFFSFHSSALPKDTLNVVDFTGDEGLSRLFVFDLHLLSMRLDLNLQEVLNKPATFTIHREGACQKFCV